MVLGCWKITGHDSSHLKSRATARQSWRQINVGPVTDFRQFKGTAFKTRFASVGRLGAELCASGVKSDDIAKTHSSFLCGWIYVLCFEENFCQPSQIRLQRPLCLWWELHVPVLKPLIIQSFLTWCLARYLLWPDRTSSSNCWWFCWIFAASEASIENRGARSVVWTGSISRAPFWTVVCTICSKKVNCRHSPEAR